MITRSLLLLLCGLLLSATRAPAQAPDSLVAGTDSLSMFDFLSKVSHAEPLAVTIRTDLRRLIRNKFKEEYQEGDLAFTAENGQPLNWKVELRARGNARKQTCYYPPVRIKFKKSELRQHGLRPGFRSYKLVNQCKESDYFAQYLLREYLAYRLYNVVSPYSFRVRLLKLTYVDTGSKDKAIETYAFLIEDVDELAGRFGGVLVEREQFGGHMVERAPMLSMALFQYMIGNTDWAFGNLHNLEIIKFPAFQKVMAVPYDFDYSGLVNAPYAIPSPELAIKTVTQRLYRGPGCEEDESRPVIDHFLALENDLLACCESVPELNEASRREMIDYLEDFFRQLHDVRYMQRVMK